jgi:2-polyprenyl-6-methoxyphenol hydroxylase-like FAD-dependent oxidoreductase
MSKILVLGAGVVGLSTAMMLADDGADVTVLERDGEPVPAAPDAAWDRWTRQGVTQFRQPHFLLPAGRQILDERLPEVCEVLAAAGCVTFDMVDLMPPSIADRAPRDGDERFVTLTGRRPAIEWAVASAAERRVRIERGCSVSGLLTGPPAADGIPHVTGVRTADGRELHADLVVDATGRRSKLPEWLEAIGARRPSEDAEDAGFIYYTRFFHSASGDVPAYRSGLQTAFHTFSVLVLPGDAGTWSVTVFIFAGDPPLKALKDNERWTALVAACPTHAHWLEGEPLTDVLPMAGVADRYRRFVVDGAPVATGVLAVGDSWACTNPIGGRGISVGLMHAAGTSDVVREHLADPLALAFAHDAMTEARVTPWYRFTAAYDRQRTAEIRAAIDGDDVAPPTGLAGALARAMAFDADVFRAAMDINALHALPEDVFARPGMAPRITDIAAKMGAAPPPPGPSRDEVLALMTA